jgi:hypothetical protein
LAAVFFTAFAFPDSLAFVAVFFLIAIRRKILRSC